MALKGIKLFILSVCLVYNVITQVSRGVRYWQQPNRRRVSLHEIQRPRNNVSRVNFATI